MGGTYLERVLARAMTDPNALFATLLLDGRWDRISYGQLLSLARRYASLFQSAGLARDEVAFIILRHGVDLYAAFLGAQLAGGLPSFLPYPNRKQDHALYWAQHQTLFARVRPRAIVAYDELAESVAGAAQGSGATVIRQSQASDVPPLADPVERGDEDLALLQHSSGTTGLKKGVALTYGAISRQIESYTAALGLTESSAVIGSWLPLYHDMGLITSCLLPLHSGAPIIAIDPFEWVAAPGLLLDAIERHGVTHVWLPNFAFMHLVRAVSPKAKYRLDTLKALINCSEPCKPAAFETFLARYADQGITGGKLQTCYAMAETVFAVSQSACGRPPRRLAVDRGALERFGRMPSRPETGDTTELLSNGPPIRGCEVAVLAEGRLQGEGYLGEICLRGDFLFDGYYRNPEATAAAFHEGWYRSGDIGFVERGELYVAGRLKDMIIVNGKNIFAHDVEACLADISGIKAGRAVAIGVYDDKAGSEQLVVIAEHSDGVGARAATISAINRAVIEETGIACAAVHIVAPGWLVKTTSGKVSRSENLRKYLQALEQGIF